MSIRKSTLQRILAILITTAMIIALIPASITSATTNKLTVSDSYDNYPYLKWTLDDDGCWYKVYRANQVDGKAGTFKLENEIYHNDYEENGYEDYNVSSGKTYYYKVVLLNDNEEQIGETNTVKYTAKLAQPYITTYTDMTTGNPVITWEKVAKADKYQIWRSTAKKGTYTRIGTVKERKYTDKKAKVGKTYYYKVKAVYSANSEANSDFSSVKSAKKIKADKKLATAVKNTPKKKVSTLENTMSLISKTDIRNLTYFDGGIFLYLEGKLKFNQIYDFSKIKKTGAVVKGTTMGYGDPYFSQLEVYPQKNGAKYKNFTIKTYGVQIHKVKKGSTKKATIESIKKTVNKYYPSKKWTVTVEKYDAKKHKGEIKEMTTIYNSYLQKSGYGKYKSNKYVLKIKNKANSKKQGWTFVTSVPTLKK